VVCGPCVWLGVWSMCVVGYGGGCVCGCVESICVVGVVVVVVVVCILVVNILSATHRNTVNIM